MRHNTYDNLKCLANKHDLSYCSSASLYTSLFSSSPDDANPCNSSNLLDHSTAAGKPKGVAVETFLQKVAACVIGSKLALDMLLNEDSIAGGYTDAINACINTVNNNFPSVAAAVALVVATAAARTIYNAMTRVHSSRFGLKYKAIVPVATTSSGTYVCSVLSNPGITVSVEIAANGSVSNMTLTTPGTGLSRAIR